MNQMASIPRSGKTELNTRPTISSATAARDVVAGGRSLERLVGSAIGHGCGHAAECSADRRGSQENADRKMDAVPQEDGKRMV